MSDGYVIKRAHVAGSMRAGSVGDAASAVNEATILRCKTH
jgi:hypothetical protein